MDKIASALKQLFQEHRIVFWYDEGEQLREEYEGLTLADVVKTAVQNNEFGVRHKLLRSQAAQQHLLYFPYAEKPNIENWLLDLQLAHQVFHAEREAMYLQELGLDYYFKDLVTQHLPFFESKERRAKLLDFLNPREDKEQDIRFNMLAVVFQTPYPDWRVYVQAYATAFMNEDTKIEKTLARFGLDTFFWRNIAQQFDYHAEEPSIYDFLLDTFARNFSLTNSAKKPVKESRVLLSFWKDAASQKAIFEQLSNRVAEDLGIAQQLQATRVETILKEDLFKVIDIRIISELVQEILTNSISSDRLDTYLKERKNKYWFAYFEDFYACLEHSLHLLEQIEQAKSITLSSVEAACAHYAKDLFRIDYHYRKFVFHYRKTEQNRVFDTLKTELFKQYSNNWLLDINNKFQDQIALESTWQQVSRHAQRGFFKQHVEDTINKGQKLFVIISDALRYENGWQVFQEIQAENRFAATLDYMVTTLPSYTQLGMAALLPHSELSIKPNSDSVLVDGMSAVGLQGRNKILQKNTKVRAKAILAEEFMKMNTRTDGRAFMKAYDLMYIYHNRIDKTGDDTTSEDKLFDAVEEEVIFLKTMLKKIANINGTNILITADHGYLYQHEKLAESDFAVTSSIKGEVWKENRRFVLGKELEASTALHAFSSRAVGLSGEATILLTKSIHRLRVKGAGSRYVHGGASLQEVVIPLISVSKKRSDTTHQVAVDIIKSTDKITTNILAVSFLQKELVSASILPRKIRVTIQAEDGTLLSDSFTYTFEASEGSERQREVIHRFQLGAMASTSYKNQRVKLVLEEPIGDSSKWKVYREYAYTLSISFTNDFDGF